MTPFNRILFAVGGAAIVACLVTAGIYVQTNATSEAINAEQRAAYQTQALGDELVAQIFEQQESLDDYMLSADPRPLARYRQAATDVSQIALQIGAHAGSQPGVLDALTQVVSENAAWQTTVAAPAIAAVQGGSVDALDEAIKAQIEDQEASQAAADELTVQLHAIDAELGARHNAVDALRLRAALLGLVVELLLAAVSLGYVRRYGLTISRDAKRRMQSNAERMEIIASLRGLRTQATPEATAGLIAQSLERLPGIDVAAVFECTQDDLLALAVIGPPGFPVRTGDTMTQKHGMYLRGRSVNGPWAERIVPAAEPTVLDHAFAALGINSRAFAPISVDGELVGLIGVLTANEDQGQHLIEDLPAVGEFASVAETILAPALAARRSRAAGRQRIAATIEAAAFRPVFQPVVDLRTDATIGFEALTRFEDGVRPDHVFGAAIDCGMGIELEMVTLEAALREARSLEPGVWLSLNVSPALLAKGGSTLGSMLSDTSRHVVLEVTEHEAIEAYAPLREAMRRLGPRVRLAVDDAGAGVANFNHLVELRPNFVKIDVGLVRGVDTDLSRQAVVAGLVHFAERAGCEVIAEGIETEAERATVMELGVTLGQGYLLARPASAETWMADAGTPVRQPKQVQPVQDTGTKQRQRSDRPLPLLGPVPGALH